MARFMRTTNSHAWQIADLQEAPSVSGAVGASMSSRCDPERPDLSEAEEFDRSVNRAEVRRCREVIDASERDQ